MEYHNVLVLEGGGAKGPIHIGELSVVEKKMRRKLIDYIDLFVTTSIGGVEGSVYTTGRMTVEEFWKFLEPNLKNIFSPKHLWSIPRYDWRKYRDLYEKRVGHCVYFGDTQADFMFTTVNMVDGRNHFPKSWKERYQKKLMTDMIHRTFAAPLFFGAVYDKSEKAIWSDGGVGFFNLPLMEAYAQIRANGWLEAGHHTHILALGAGRKKYALDFDKEAKKGKLRKAAFEIKRFFSKGEGGMARAVSAITQVNMMKKLERTYSNLTFQWVDWFPMDKKLDKMDNWKARFCYYNHGRDLGDEITLDYFEHKIRLKNGMR